MIAWFADALFAVFNGICRSCITLEKGVIDEKKIL